MQIRVPNGWSVVHQSLLNEDPEYDGEVCINLTEDLLQLKRGTDVVDVGFYRDHYRVVLIRDGDWDNPLREQDCRHRRDVVGIVENWMSYL